MPNFPVRSGEGGWGTARADLDGPVSEVVASPLGNVRLARAVHPSSAAVVLGRGQPEAHVDRAAAAAHGLTVARRSSGGSAVLVVPEQLVWIDVVVPAGDALWDDDVGRAAWWLGERWLVALASIGIAGATVHRGAMVRGRWAARVCFDGTGSGEVMIGDRKVVGIAQRRTRDAALFQCAALIEWEPSPLADVLQVPLADVRECGIGLGSLAGVGPAVVEEAFFRALG